MVNRNSEMTCRDRLHRAADALRGLCEDSGADPRTAVILGSGLQQTATEALQEGASALSFTHVPGMPITRVSGHTGQFVTGGSRNRQLILQQGRSHYYEGWDVDAITFSVRVLAELGVKTLIVTNAAGGIAPEMMPGDLMVIRDHLCFVDLNEPQAEFGERQSVPGGADTGFCSRAALTGACRTGRSVWSQRMMAIAADISTSLSVHRGCYAMMPGPNYETPAEVRMLRSLGVDAVGMSTVPEAMVASRLGMEVLGVSCITNSAAGLSAGPLTHQEVGETAARVESDFVGWLQQVVQAACPSELA